MSLLSWVLFFGGAAGLVVFAFWIYRNRELTVRSRWLLVSLRATTLVVLLLILFNPDVPDGGRAAGGQTKWLLIDGSVSMSSTGGDGESLWSRAVAPILQEAESDAEIFLFGDGLAPLDSDSLATMSPILTRSLLAPALERALESGVSDLTVVSDGRLLDPLAVEGLIAEFGLSLDFRDVGEEIVNAGITSVELPAELNPGEEFEARISLRGSGLTPGDSLTVEITEEDSVILTRRVPVPVGVGTTAIAASLRAPEEEGQVFYSIRLVGPSDAFLNDDRISRFVTVGPESGGVVLLSLEPDWEPRFLLPVLRQVTGLSARGFMFTSQDRLIPMSIGGEEGAPIELESFIASVSAADLIVLHGVGDRPSDWLLEIASAAPRLIVSFGQEGDGAGFGLGLGRRVLGEWYASEELPPSPLGPALAGFPLQDLPPLEHLRPLNQAAAGLIPLEVRLAGEGREEAALMLTEEGERRVAYVLASGFWRWAFRPGEPRDAYRRLWAGVSGWLLESSGVRAVAFVRPTESVVASGRLVQWMSPAGGEPIRLRILQGDSLVADTTLQASDVGSFSGPPLPPAVYSYESFISGEPSGSGRFAVTDYSDDLLVPRWAPTEPRTDETVSVSAALIPGRRSLRTHPAPYLVILVLLSCEWILRRRRGLR